MSYPLTIPLLLSTHITIKPYIPTLITNGTNWEMVHTYLDKHRNLNIKIKDSSELDQSPQYFTTLIQRITWHLTQSVNPKTIDTSSIPLHICQLVRKITKQRWYNYIKRLKLHNIIVNARNDSFEQSLTNFNKEEHTI